MNHFFSRSMIPVVGWCFLLLVGTTGHSSAQVSTPVDTGAVYTIVEEMPRFPGCEDLDGDHRAKKACADQKMLKYIYNNWVFPDSARKAGVCEMVVVSFVIDEAGHVTEITLLRNPGYGVGESVAELLRRMNDLPERWTPGRQQGQAVKVKYHLPFRYHLR